MAAKLAVAGDVWVTVRIEEEAAVEASESAFGMWGDRGDMADVAEPE